MDPLKPDATPEEIKAYLDLVMNKMTEMQTNLDAVIAERDTAKASLEEANGKLSEIENAKTMAEVDALLADYDLPDETKAAMSDLAKSNRPQAEALLKAVPKRKPVEEKVETGKLKVEEKAPPAPLHNPGKETVSVSPEEEAAKIKTRTVELQKNNPRMSYAAAFAQAEKEIRAKS